MCGIIGFAGNGNAVSKLLAGLDALEYRGYDSAGIAYFDDGMLKMRKTEGRLESLKRITSDLPDSISSGIGHTRWATHGEVSDRNSHPHGNGRVYGVHNGIIENYAEISKLLEEKGYTFTSDTDTERAILLIDCLYAESGDPISAMFKGAKMIKGSFAFALMFAGIPETVYAMRRDSPLLACPSESGSFVASDVSATLRETNRFAVIEEGELAVLTRDSIRFFCEKGGTVTEKEKTYERSDLDPLSAEKGEYPHFMLKEIYEEPDAFARSVLSRISDGKARLGLSDETEAAVRNAGHIHIVACGTAMHAGLMGKYAIEKLCRVPVSVEIASEFRYRDPIIGKNDLVIIISQSGETADTLAALRLAKKCMAHTLAIVNVKGSTIAREACDVLYTYAGPEIAVASTKAYSVQLGVLYLLAIHMGTVRGALTESDAAEYLYTLSTMTEKIRKALKLSAVCEDLAGKYHSHRSIFFMGRGQDYGLSMEAALKMKEITYIHCEAYAAGELKHGTISLIEEGTPVFVFATEKHLFDKTVSNIKEVSSRGARVLLVCPAGFDVPQECYADLITLPECEELFMPLCSVVTAQLLAYHTALKLGRDVDKPRNLAKSVTVE